MDSKFGVSVGSANLTFYAAKQARRNLRFCTEYGRHKECAGNGNYIAKRSSIDLDDV